MKKLSIKNISALCALLLAGTILTSAKSNHISNTSSDKPTAKELEYYEEIESYMKEYFEEEVLFEEAEFEVTDHVKVYDEDNKLVVEGEKSELSTGDLQTLHQADLLTEANGTAYYRLNK